MNELQIEAIWDNKENIPVPYLFLTPVDVSEITSTEPLYSTLVNGFLWPNKWYYKHISRTYSTHQDE